MRFLLDRRARALEFCFYWRHWGWAGYRLGDRFATQCLGDHVLKGKGEPVTIHRVLGLSCDDPLPPGGNE